MAKRSLLDKFEEIFDSVRNRFESVADFTSEKIGDAWRWVVECLVGAVSTGFVVFVNSFYSYVRSTRNPVIRLLLKALALPLIILLWLSVQAFMNVYGLFGTLIGLRRGREFLFAENLIVWSPLVLLGVLAPWLGLGEFGLNQVSLFYAYSIVILGLNIQLGLAGQTSLGHGAFVLIGGYAATILRSNERLNLNFYSIPAVVCGGLVAAAVGLAVGLPAARARLKGPYLALLTLGLMLSISPFLKHPTLREYTGGSDGIAFSSPAPPDFLNFISQPAWMYFHSFGFFVVMFVAAQIMIKRLKIGRALIAVHEGEERCNVLGISETRYKMVAFGLAAFYAGIGGGLFILQMGFISPDSVTSHDSMDYLVALFVGGNGTFLGSAIGGAFIAYNSFLTAFISKYIQNGEQLLWGVYGIVLILVMIFSPHGIAGGIHHYFFDKRFSLPNRRKHRRDIFPDYDIEEEMGVVATLPASLSHDPARAEDPASPPNPTLP